jgi:CRISPR-associated protein Cmr3
MNETETRNSPHKSTFVGDNSEAANSLWLITPRDPLITRDSRPFNNTAGARATSLAFPLPSVTTGGARTRAGSINGVFDTTKIANVLQIAVRGPFLVEERTDATGQWEYLFPAPADALLFDVPKAAQSPKEDNKKTERCARLELLTPKKLDDNEITDFTELEYVLAFAETDQVQEKPLAKPPQFWKAEKFMEWLRNPHSNAKVLLSEWGHDGPQRESRMHVAIDLETSTNVEGMLFQTSGMEYVAETKNMSRLGLAVQVDNLGSLSIEAGIGALGGERRLVNWSQPNSLEWPKVPDDILNKVAEKKRCRVVLLTPAWFNQGWMPAYLSQVKEGLHITLKAAAVGRAQVISGWDLAKNTNNGGQAKPTRRLAPAGSVYYLEFEGSEDQIKKWVREKWFAAVSDDDDDDQTRRDGFGVAAIGVWEEN